MYICPYLSYVVGMYVHIFINDFLSALFALYDTCHRGVPFLLSILKVRHIFTYMTFGLAFLVFDTIRLMVLSDFAIKQCPRTQLTAAIQL